MAGVNKHRIRQKTNRYRDAEVSIGSSNELIHVVQNPLRKKRANEELKPFEISGMYLLNAHGIVIFHKNIAFHKEFDADIFGSMFTAIKMFIEGSLRSNSELRNIDYGQFKILIEQGNEFFLVVVGKGDMIDPVRELMGKVVKNIDQRYGKVIAHWTGEMEVFEEIEDDLHLITNEVRNNHGTKEGINLKVSKEKHLLKEEIKIPYEYARKIDRIINTGMSRYPSRDEFIKGAVEMKLNEFKAFS